MKSKITVLIVIVSFMVNMDAFAAPLNDNFINATLISGISGSATGNNVNATLEIGEHKSRQMGVFPLPGPVGLV